MRNLFFVGACFFLFNLIAADFPGGDFATEMEAGIADMEKKRIDEDDLKIGGDLTMEYDYRYLDSHHEEAGALSMPHELNLYMDARKKNDIRGYIKGKYLADTKKFTLDEMKMMLNLSHKVFMTLGRQKIKWGAGKFWNPTDFMNINSRDPLSSEDSRSGVDLIKVHVPIGNSNFYMLADLTDADTVKKTKAAMRLEIPFSSSEISISALYKEGEGQKLGVDASVGIGDFDVYAEYAEMDFSEVVLGFVYEIQYSDEDSLNLIGEYFFMERGETETPNYSALLFWGNYHPYHEARHYAMLGLNIPNPGKFNNLNLSIFNIMNIVDSSFITRLEAAITSYTDVVLSPFIGYHYGRNNGEFGFGEQFLDLGFSCKI